MYSSMRYITARCGIVTCKICARGLGLRGLRLRRRTLRTHRDMLARAREPQPARGGGRPGRQKAPGSRRDPARRPGRQCRIVARAGRCGIRRLSTNRILCCAVSCRLRRHGADPPRPMPVKMHIRAGRAQALADLAQRTQPSREMGNYRPVLQAMAQEVASGFLRG